MKDIKNHPDYEETVKRIAFMGIKVMEFNGIPKLFSENYGVKVLPDSELEWSRMQDKPGIRNNEDWENHAAEVDNMSRAILWIRQLYNTFQN